MTTSKDRSLRNYVYKAKDFGTEEFELLEGSPTRQDIRVGYIDPDKGYVTGRNICDANRHAKLNPGAQFIIKTRDRVRYMNVNEVNTLSPEESFDTNRKGMGIPQEPCKGVEMGVPPSPPVAEFMGGGGVGVKGNPVIGKDGSVLAIHLVDGGFGYKYPPLVDVTDPTQIGGGVVAQAFIGELAEGLEVYSDEKDLEEYFPVNPIDPSTGQTIPGYNVRALCDSENVDVSYGRVWTPDGKDVGIWDPTLYSDFELDPFRKKIEDYQAFLAALKTPWWVTRRRGDVNTPLSVSSSWDQTVPEYFYEVRPGFTKNTVVYPVGHKKWGGFDKSTLEKSKIPKQLPILSQGGPETGLGSTNYDLEDVEFKFFVAVAAKYAKDGFRWVFRELKEEPFPEQPIYKGEDRYGPHRFIVSPADMKNNAGGKRDLLSPKIETIVKKVKMNTQYQVIAEGSASGYGVEQGLVDKMRTGGKSLSGGHNTEIVGENQVGKMIFADLIASENDDDDMQLGATAGSFTQKNRRPGVKGKKLKTAEAYEKNGRRVTSKKKGRKLKGTAYTTTKKVLDNNGRWIEEETPIKEWGRDTYDVFYKVTPEELGESKGLVGPVQEDKGEKKKGDEGSGIIQSFMNKYAISPVPMSNDRGSDYAGQLFSIQWDQVFPHGGQYHFRGQSDNYCSFWLDNEWIADLNSYHGTPWEWKPEFSWKGSDEKQPTVKNIRLELRNDPELEDMVVQQEGDEWVDPGGILDYEEVPFDIFVHVAKRWERWENLAPELSTPQDRTLVCFNSVGKGGGTGSSATTVKFQKRGQLVVSSNTRHPYVGYWRLSHNFTTQFGGRSYGESSHTIDPSWGPQDCWFAGIFYPGFIRFVDNWKEVQFAQSREGLEGNENKLRITCTTGEFRGAGKKLNTIYYYDMKQIGGEATGSAASESATRQSRISLKWHPETPPVNSTEKFIITPLNVATDNKVTFTVTSNAGDTNTFRMRAPGTAWDFSISRAGTKTVEIPRESNTPGQVRQDEVHILGHNGKIKWINNWRTMLFEDRPGGTDFDDLIVTCSTGRFRSNGRKLNTEYSYKYPNFVPTITWEHDGLGDIGEIVLTETEAKCVELRTGVDYGIRFVTDTGESGRDHGANILDGQSTAQKIAYSVGTVTGPFDDLVVTCDKGRFRSKDGTDDWGYFGHSGNGPSGSSTRKDQILWSMPKETKSVPFVPASSQGLQFTFESADKSERFTIRSNEVKNNKGDQRWGKGLRYTSGIQQITRKIKVNTKYRVWASVNDPDGGEKVTRCEQGLIQNMGRRPNEEPFAKSNSTGKYIMADIIPTDNDDDDIQLGATKGIFRTNNRRRHTYRPPKSEGGAKVDRRGRWTYDIEYELTKKVKDDRQLKGSTSSKILTKEIFCTTGSNWLKPNSSPNGQMYRINEVGDNNTKQGFLNEYGVTPFNPRKEYEDNPFEGTHKMVWNNVNFPISGDYNIKVDVDDSVELLFEGPDGINLLRKNGFDNGRATGPSVYTEYFPKGSYKITANLTQIEGGVYTFTAMTDAEKEALRQREFEQKRNEVKKPIMTSVTFNQGSRAGFTNSSVITGLFKLTRNGTETREVEIGKQYNVAFSSSGGNHRVKLKIANNGRTIKMEDWTDNDWNDLVLTCSGGKFHSLNGRFCTYEGGPNVGSADEAALREWELNPIRSIDDIALKGANPMALAVKVTVSYATAQRIIPRSWYENPLGVAFTIEAPLPKPPQQKKPKAEGRCPNNPFWTTRFSEDADKTWYPVRNNKKEDNGEWMWDEFLNKYAMSPLPPLAWSGTDFGGRWFTNEWNIEVPYDGYYRFKMLADDEAKLAVKGTNKPIYEQILETKKWKGNPAAVQLKLYEGKGKIRVDVKNRDTTVYDTIHKKIFSARDWVGEPGASDADWEGVADPKRFKDVSFDVFSQVRREFISGPEQQSNKVCFKSVGKAGNGGSSGGGATRVDFSIYKTELNKRYGGSFVFADRWERGSPGSGHPQGNVKGGNGADVVPGNSYPVYFQTFSKYTTGGTKLLIYFLPGSLNKDTPNFTKLRLVQEATGDDIVVECTKGQFHSPGRKEGVAYEYTGFNGSTFAGGIVWRDVAKAGSGSIEKFILTPLNGPKNENVTFTVTSNAGDTNTFRLRAPGQPFDFSISRAGTKTVRIPFGREDEVHVLANRGKIKWTDNWQTMLIEDRPNGTDFDDLIIKCSTGRFRSEGRKLNTEYSYKYPHFVPTITWGHGTGSTQGEVVLTETDNWCGELESGVDYGVRFETDGTQSGRNHGANILDGKTTGQEIAYSVGSVTGPFDDLVVTCDKGRFRSKDGTDDWGYFGHSGSGPGGSSDRADQILWSMPKINPGSGIEWNPNVDGLRFTFSAKDGSHSFDIRPQELKEGNKSTKSLFVSAGVQKITKRMKLNTVYKVLASVSKPQWKESMDRCEQGLVKSLGIRPEEEPFAKKNTQGKYIMGDIIHKRSANDDDDIQIGAIEGIFTQTNRRRHDYRKDDKVGGKGRWTYDLTYEVKWDPPPVFAENVTKTGTVKEGVTYEGPYLMHYVERGWSSYMNKMNVAPIVRADLNLALYEDDILGKKVMTWKGVKFDHPGDYHVRFLADNIGKFYVNDEKLLDANDNYKGNKDHFETVSIANSGPQTIRVELDNDPTGHTVFYDNPTGMVLEITKPLTFARMGPDGRVVSDSWVQNPVAVSAECIPPPCSKIREGKGVVQDVQIVDPGNGFPESKEVADQPDYPTVNKLKAIKVLQPGINYTPGDVLEVDTGTGPPIVFNLELGPFGGISSVPDRPGQGPPDDPRTDIIVNQWPQISVATTYRPPNTRIGHQPTGVNAQFIPVIVPEPLLPPNIDPRTGLVVPPEQIIQVTDLAGIKRTGFYNGKPYYGAVFYKDGVRYAGYYETAGVLIQIYDTLQESVDAQVTTPPSAIRRQGTDVSSQDPRLDIPGTPQ